MINIKNPDIEKHLVVSTAHISKEDSDLLDLAIQHPLSAVGMCLSIDRYDYGYRIFVGTSEHKSDALTHKNKLNELGFSKEFSNLVEITYDLKCKFLCLDGDGKKYKELKEFNW